MEDFVKEKEQAIQAIADMLREIPFSIEYKVKKKPTGVKIVIEVTQEGMEQIIASSILEQ